MAKKNTIKKSTKTKKSKFSLKNVNFKKNWKKLSYLSLIGVLVLTSFGYGIWKRVDEERAEAYGYSRIATYFYGKREILACRIGTSAVQLVLKNETSESVVSFWWFNGGKYDAIGFTTTYKTIRNLNASTLIWGRVQPNAYGSATLRSLQPCPPTVR